METIKTKVKKWGNSFGIILPMKIVEREHLREGSEIDITLNSNKITTVGDLMRISRELGLDKKLKNVDTEKALREIDKAFRPKGE